jgi:hypothetical protein
MPRHRESDLVTAAAYGSKTARFWGDLESLAAIIRESVLRTWLAFGAIG